MKGWSEMGRIELSWLMEWLAVAELRMRRVPGLGKLYAAAGAQSTVEYALGHAALGKDFRKYLRSLDLSSGSGSDKRAAKGGSKERISRTRRGDSRRGNGAAKHAR